MAARRIEQDRRNEDFRGMLARMEREGHVRRVTKTISPRHITALCGQAASAVLCETVEDYDIPVVGGLYWTRDRLASALDWPVAELGSRFATAVARPLSPVFVNDAPCQEVVSTDDDVDLTFLALSGWLIIAAMVFDTLDGAAARAQRLGEPPGEGALTGAR